MSYYKKGQLIWAKIKGYPWWPGVVAKANSDKYGNLDKEVVVNFIGENSHAVLTQDKVADFVEKRKQYSLNKNKKLQESIQIAEKILEVEERSRLEDLEDSSSEDSGSEDSSDEGEDQEKEIKSNRSSSSKKSKSDSVSISEAVWKDTESLLGTKSAKKSQDSDDSEDKSSDGSSDDSRSITSERPSSKDKRKAKKLEKRKAKQDKRKAAENKLKKKKSLEGKISKSNSLQPESTRGKTASVDKSKHSKNPKEPTPLKSRRIKGKLLIDEDGETENFWKSPQKFSKEAQAAEENNSEGLVRKKKGKKLNIDSMSEISQTENTTNKPMGIIPSSSLKAAVGIEVEEEEKNSKEAITANGICTIEFGSSPNMIAPNEPPPQKQEFDNDDDVQEQEEGGVKKKLKLENSFVEISKIEEDEEKEPHKTIDRAREIILKRFEKDLEELLRQISTKVKASIKLDDRDSDILKLLQTMEEFESKEMQGSELVHTKIGKIFKTIHFVLIRHKSHLPENCDIIITTLAKILHIIKNRIMKYSMDNSEYLQLLKIIPENEKIEPSLINLLDINFEKIRMKVEENISNQQPLPLLAKPADVKESLSASLDTEILLQPPSLLTDIQNIPQNLIKGDLMEEEEQRVGDNMTSIPLRKKVCKKLAKVLQKCYLLEKNNAQELTIQIEDKLNRLNNGKENEYKQTIKVLHKLMKARRLKLDELNKFSSLDDIFKSKIQTNQRNEFTKKT